MKLTPSAHLQIRLQNLLFTVLFLSAVGMLAWLSTRFTIEADWTREGRNTLSEASRKVLDNLEGTVNIAVFVLENDTTRTRIRDLVGRYQRHKTNLRLNFINPDLAPDKAEDFSVTQDGEMVIEFDGRREMLREVNEASLTNALQRLARADERWITF
ncbi:MAG: Gldg family protein, partial [Pseudomonadota bacterium]